MIRNFSTLCGGRRAYEIETGTALHEYVKRNRPTGGAALGLFGGVAVWLLDGAGDECIAAWQQGDGFSGAHRHTIHYSTAGRPFIKKGGRRFYFDEFLRV